MRCTTPTALSSVSPPMRCACWIRRMRQRLSWRGRWPIADGGWQMADGGWQMADGRWQMADSDSVTIMNPEIKRLIDGLADPESDARLEAVSALGQYGASNEDLRGLDTVGI